MRSQCRTLNIPLSDDNGHGNGREEYVAEATACRAADWEKNWPQSLEGFVQEQAMGSMRSLSFPYLQRSSDLRTLADRRDLAFCISLS